MIVYFWQTQLETSQKRNRNRNKVQYIDFTSPPPAQCSRGEYLERTEKQIWKKNTRNKLYFLFSMYSYLKLI